MDLGLGPDEASPLPSPPSTRSSRRGASYTDSCATGKVCRWSDHPCPLHSHGSSCARHFARRPSLITSFGARAPVARHPFGTTPKGQDVLALNLWGGRGSLLVGFIVGVAATSSVSSWASPRRTSDGSSTTCCPWSPMSSCCCPGLPLLVILAAFLPQGLGTVIIVLVVTGWAGSARVLRSQARRSGEGLRCGSAGHR